MDLRILNRAGLIEYTAGKPLKWEGIASEIRRILPIPRPTTKTVELLRKLKTKKGEPHDTLDTSSCRDKMQFEMGTK
jgi:hypothetical protein